MGSKAKPKPMRKERENRADTKVDNTFHPFTITPESCGTAVLLLDSEEPEILCQTLRALSKFAAQDKVNCVQLFNLGAIDMVIKHVQHGVLNVLRFALKCLALLCQLPSGPERVLENPENLRKFALMISKMEDVFVLEFSSLVLAELTREPLGCEQLLNCNILSNLFARMKNSLDPDVQKNCLQILCNLLNDPVSAGEVTKNPNFSWSSLLILLNSKFLAIQHAALRIVEQLISRYKDVIIQRSFRASTGLTDLTDILDSYEFRDIHAVVLRVLRNYVETEESAEHLFQSGAVLRLLDYLEMALPAMKPHCLAVLTKMSYSVSGRDALFQTGTDLVFCHQLLSSNVDLLADAALGVANMTKLLPSAVRMSDTNVIEALCAILTDDSAIWFYVRMNALRALVELCYKIPKAAYSLVEPKTFNALRTINKRFKDNPIEAQRLAVECYMSLESYEASARAMATREFILELLTIFQRPDTSLRVLTANVLAGLMTAEGVREFFSKGGGEKILSENLMEEQVELRNALCNLIIASISDEGADTYLELGTLHYMITNRVARYTIPFWEGAIEVIFRHHPAAKLAYTGMLDIQDFTREGFYVQKRLDEIFPSIKQARQCDPPFENPVFYVSFAQAAPEFQARATFRRTITAVIEGSPPSAAKEKGLNIPDDPSLRDYLAKLLLWLGDPSKSVQYIEYEDAHFEAKYRDKCNAVSTTIRFRAELLGEFVADQMSGLTQDRDCSVPGVDLHLADLMIALGTRVVGLGHVRCGGALERAVLYKVLADRIALPCALYRGTGGHAWVEVAIPEADPDDPLDHKNAYPVGLLRSNYVVDLMKHPGRLLRAGCHDASAITGQRPRQPYVARKLPEICRCAAVHSVRLTIPSSQSTAPLGSTASPAGC